MKKVDIQFFGAAGTVTGSKFHITAPDINIMVDCGLFQGVKEIRQQNWNPLPIALDQLDVVLLTHGHLDHTGYLPLLLKAGFQGQILGTAPSLHIAEVIMNDSGKIQEELAEQANREKFSKHNPALPLYTVKDAQKVPRLFKSVLKDVWIPLSDEVRCRFRYNGHIIGSTFIELDISGKIFVFSGDVGRPDDLLLYPSERPEWADYLFMESTYGDRTHPEEDVDERLALLISDTIKNKGMLVIPTFAVERLQSVMYRLWLLYDKNRIPNIPIFVDSPMGNNVLDVFEAYPQWHKLKTKTYRAMCNRMNIIENYSETWKTIDDPRPKIVIAGSGMVTGGRVLTYLSQVIKKESTTLLLVGFQAEGTRGRKLLEGAPYIKIFGKEHPVNAKIEHFESLSAHADQQELIQWVSNIKNRPEQVYLIHGEPAASLQFKNELEKKFKWRCHIPELYEKISLLLN
ncbi:MAG: MBL fold metallo-hydrolase [Croceitalea sp.]|nr:MBL fold metallo-hydrolase [Croceitalea sp.]